MRVAWRLGSTIVLLLWVGAFGAGCVGGHLGRPSEREILKRILGSSVQVVLERNGDRFRTGSGVIIGVRPDGASTDCLVLTSAHTFNAVGPASETYVLLDRHQGPGRRGRARVLAVREADEVDLALLEAPVPGCGATALGRPPALGDRIWIVGFPWGRQLRLIGGTRNEIVSVDSLDFRAKAHELCASLLYLRVTVSAHCSSSAR